MRWTHSVLTARHLNTFCQNHRHQESSEHLIFLHISYLGVWLVCKNSVCFVSLVAPCPHLCFSLFMHKWWEEVRKAWFFTFWDFEQSLIKVGGTSYIYLHLQVRSPGLPGDLLMHWARLLSFISHAFTVYATNFLSISFFPPFFFLQESLAPELFVCPFSFCPDKLMHTQTLSLVLSERFFFVPFFHIVKCWKPLQRR